MPSPTTRLIDVMESTMGCNDDAVAANNGDLNNKSCNGVRFAFFFNCNCFNRHFSSYILERFIVNVIRNFVYVCITPSVSF